MDYRIIRISRLNISELMKAKLRPLTIPGGLMWPTFTSKELKGVWVALSPSFDITGWPIIGKPAFYHKDLAQFFVSKHSRRKGIGTKLVTAMRHEIKRLDARVLWHDNTSREFFNKNKLQGF